MTAFHQMGLQPEELLAAVEGWANRRLAKLPPQALSLAWLGPVITAVQHLVPSHMRSTASASFLLINNLVGIGLGIYLLGAVSKALTPIFAEEALRYSLYVGQWFYALAAILLIISARSLKKDWVD